MRLVERLNGASRGVEEVSSSAEDYTNVVASIPEYCGNDADPLKEYENYPETRLWIPAFDEVHDEWSPSFLLLAKSALTLSQEIRGISNQEAMENACTGMAEQYISDVFHYSGYVPRVTLWLLLTTAVPVQLTERWSAVDATLFEEGLKKYGKKFFSIRTELLPHKTTMELVNYYYTWKRTDMTKGVLPSRARQFLKKRRRRTNVNLPPIEPMTTRSRSRKGTSSLDSATSSDSQVDVIHTAKRRRRR